MAEPTLSTEQKNALKSALSLAQAGADGAKERYDAMQASIKSQEDLDGAMKTLFNYNHINVISQYETERRWIDGQLLQAPIVEQDLVSFVTRVGSRLDNGESRDIKRISQFDGVPTAYVDPMIQLKKYPIQTIDPNELAQFDVQDYFVNLLANGFTGPSPSQTIQTGTVIGPNSTSLNTQSVSGGIGVSVGQWLLIGGTSESAVIEVNSVQTAVSGSFPATIGFVYVVPPTGSIATGASIGSSFVITNAERTTHVTTIPARQNILDFWMNRLKDSLVLRKSALDHQIRAFDANGNSQKVQAARQSADTSRTFITSYLGLNPPATMDVSNTGLSSLTTERNTRKARAVARVGDIKSEILKGEGNGSFYDRRFALAVARTNLGNGSLFILKELQALAASSQASQASASALAARWSSFLK